MKTAVNPLRDVDEGENNIGFYAIRHLTSCRARVNEQSSI
jgi:hypothetical protein